MIVGGLVLVPNGSKLESRPNFVYIGNINSQSAVLGVSLKGGMRPILARVLFSNTVERTCQVADGSEVGTPKSIGTDVAFYSFHQAHSRRIDELMISVPARSSVSVSCNVSDLPDRETFTSRRIAFSPPGNTDIMTAARRDGYEAVWPISASIQRVTESTGFTSIGGDPVHDDTIGAIEEAVVLTPQDRILRAYWTDEPARSWQTFWLFFLALVAALGVAMILEAIRPSIDALSKKPG
jgi:hypothetical protein